MLTLSSRSATVMVILIVAIVAFCLASVFAAMTGPISILPNESESGGILDNLSAITDENVNNGNSYGYEDYNDYSSSDSSSDKVETTTEDTSSNTNPSSDQVETTTDNPSPSSSSPSSESSDSGSSNVVTSTDKEA